MTNRSPLYRPPDVELTVPLAPGRIAHLRLPLPFERDDLARLVAVLESMLPGLGEPDEPAPDAELVDTEALRRDVEAIKAAKAASLSPPSGVSYWPDLPGGEPT